MKFSSMRSAIVIASVVAGSVIPTQAFAEIIDVFKGIGNTNNFGGTMISTYQFTDAMTLNSIGFLTFGNVSNFALSYEINNDGYLDVTNTGVQDSSGLQWFDLGSGLSVNTGTIVKVRTSGAISGTTGGQNTGTNVSYLGINGSAWGTTSNTGYTNSNLRVSPSNPGSNVAPEPGTFALALTGGAALIGICIRRRRNAA